MIWGIQNDDVRVSLRLATTDKTDDVLLWDVT